MTLSMKPIWKTKVPSDWDVVNSGKAVKYFGGNAFDSNDAKESGIRWLKIANVGVEIVKWEDISFLPETFVSLHSRYALKEGDVVMALTRPILNDKLKIAILYKNDVPSLLNQRVAKLIPKGNICIGYIYYIHQMPYFIYLMNTTMAGTDPPNIGSGDLEKIKIPLPPLSEQKAIAAVLSLMDSAINKTNQLIAQKELQKKALMQQLLTGKKRLKGFGREWKNVRIGDIFERVTRKNIEVNSNVVTISAQNGFIRQSDYFNKIVASDILDNYFLVEKGEFCYNKSYSNGYPWGATKRLNDFEKAVVTTLYICFRIMDKLETYGDFFEQYFESGALENGLTKIAHEGGRAHGLLNVTPTDFFNIRISTPSYSEQVAIVKVLQSADKEIQLLKSKSAKLKEQKKGMMQVLLTGKKRLKGFKP